MCHDDRPFSTDGISPFAVSAIVGEGQSALQHDWLTQPPHLWWFLPCVGIFVYLLGITYRAWTLDPAEGDAASKFGPDGAIPAKMGCLVEAILVVSVLTLAGFAWWPWLDWSLFTKIGATVILTPLAFVVCLIAMILVNKKWSRWVAKMGMRSKLANARDWLNHGTEEQKKTACVIVGYCASDAKAAELLPALIEHFGSSNDELRYLAACACWSVLRHHKSGPDGMEASLRALLKDPDLKVRAPAARALVAANLATSQEIAVPLASALGSNDGYVWGQVTHYFDTSGYCDPSAVPVLFEAVASNEELDTFSVALGLANVPASGIAKLKKGLRHSNERVRTLAKEVLDGLQKSAP